MNKFDFIAEASGYGFHAEDGVEGVYVEGDLAAIIYSFQQSGLKLRDLND